jgi:hypothetical protein
MICPACQQPAAFVAGRCVKCGHVVPTLARAAAATAVSLGAKGAAGARKETTRITVGAPSRPVRGPETPLSPLGREYVNTALALGKTEGFGVDGNTPPTETNVSAAGGWNAYVRRLKEWLPAVPSMAEPSGATNASALWVMFTRILWSVLLAPVFAVVVGGLGAIGAWIVTFVATLIVKPLQEMLGETSGLVVAAIAIGKKWVAVMAVVLIVPAGFWGTFLGESVEEAGRKKGNENRGTAMLFAFMAGIVTVFGAGLCVWAVLGAFHITIPVPQDNRDAAEAVTFIAQHLLGISLGLSVAFGVFSAVMCAKSFARARICPKCHVEMKFGRSITLPIGVTRLIVLAAKAGNATALRGALRVHQETPMSKKSGAPGVAEGELSGYQCPKCGLGVTEVALHTHSWGLSEWNHKPEAQNEARWLAWSGELKDEELGNLLAHGPLTSHDAAGEGTLGLTAKACGCANIKLEINCKRSTDDPDGCYCSSRWTVWFTAPSGSDKKDGKAPEPAEALHDRLETQPMVLKDASGQILDRAGEARNVYNVSISQDFLCSVNPVFPLSLQLPWGSVEVKASTTGKPS